MPHETSNEESVHSLEGITMLTAVLKKTIPIFKLHHWPLLFHHVREWLSTCKPRTPVPRLNKFRHIVLLEMNSFPIQDKQWVINGTFADSFINNLHKQS
jgi:hypothetical protein